MKTLFECVTAVLMDDNRTILRDAYVTVEGGKIASVGTERPSGDFDRIIHGAGNVLMPGFVNAHTHVPMTAMRGYGGGNNLQDWLYKFIFPAEAKWDDRAIRAATALGLAEMIASGVTCIADMYMRCDSIIQEVLAAGLSANICCGGTLFTEDFDPNTHSDCIAQRHLTETWHKTNDGQILIDASIHGEYTSRAPLWDWMAQYAATHNLGMHIHLSETRDEHKACIARYGMTPAAVMAQHGVFDVRAIAAHCVWTTPDDWAIMTSHGVSAIHNPMSNLKLGSGVAPVPAMQKAGVNVALGTDGVASNNATNVFEDMKLAAILHNGVNHDPMAISAYDALNMATVNGAKALGRNTGRIAVGCDADLILIDFDKPNNYPCHDVIENLAYATHGSDVVMNMCRGQVIYQNGEFLTIDMEKVCYEMEHHTIPLLFGDGMKHS